MALIRSMLTRLRPHELETVGLRGTLQDLVTGWQARMADRFSCSLQFEGPIDSTLAAAQYHPVPADPGVPDQCRAPLTGAGYRDPAAG